MHTLLSHFQLLTCCLRQCTAPRMCGCQQVAYLPGLCEDCRLRYHPCSAPNCRYPFLLWLQQMLDNTPLKWQNSPSNRVLFPYDMARMTCICVKERRTVTTCVHQAGCAAQPRSQPAPGLLTSAQLSIELTCGFKGGGHSVGQPLQGGHKSSQLLRRAPGCCGCLFRQPRAHAVHREGCQVSSRQRIHVLSCNSQRGHRYGCTSTPLVEDLSRAFQTLV